MSTPDGFSDNPLVAEMERRCADMLLVSQAVLTCADVFEQACEPRAPKPEWLRKWPYWQVLDSEGNLRYARIEIKSLPECHPGCECCCGPSILCRIVGEGMPIAIDPQAETVMPVTGKGPIIPVGWKVVE